MGWETSVIILSFQIVHDSQNDMSAYALRHNFAFRIPKMTCSPLLYGLFLPANPKMTMNNLDNTTINCHELFAQFSNKLEAMILVYLLAEADSKGRVNCSIYALAQQLNMHRQTLTRIINNLCKKGYATWRNTAAHGQHHQLYVTYNVTDCVTDDVTDGVTDDVTCTQEKNDAVTPSVSSIFGNMENKLVTTDVTDVVTLGVTDNVTCKKETKENKEENPPAPPKEEKKQKKEKISPSPVRAREKNPETKYASTKANIEQRRQDFINSLTSYTSRYGEEMIRHFGEYWTETNRTNTRMRFEMQNTWNTHLRLARWARNEHTFNQNNNNYDKKRPTSADYIREAQLYAINATEEFIRQAEIRRGGVPPHLPF